MTKEEEFLKKISDYCNEYGLYLWPINPDRRMALYDLEGYRVNYTLTKYNEPVRIIFADRKSQ